MEARAQTDLCIRRATPADLDGICRIEAEAFITPWSRQALATELERDRALFTVAGLTDSGVIDGFMCTWLVADEAHILKIAVDCNLRRRGIGTRLLTDAMACLKERGAKMAYLEVRPSNAAARRFYERAGFDRIGRRPRYYPDSGEDALVLFKGLT